MVRSILQRAGKSISGMSTHSNSNPKNDWEALKPSIHNLEPTLSLKVYSFR